MWHCPHCGFKWIRRVRVHLYVLFLSTSKPHRANQIQDDTVDMLIWSATESCVTIMCSSIPVLRPLYLRIRYGPEGKDSSPGNTSYKLPMYGSGSKHGSLSKSGLEHSVIEPSGKSFPQDTVVRYNTNNTSDENILEGAAGIERTDEFSVSYELFPKKT